MNLFERFGEFGVRVVVDTAAEIFEDFLTVLAADRENIGKAEGELVLVI